MTWTTEDQRLSSLCSCRRQRKAHRERIGTTARWWSAEEDSTATDMFRRGKTIGQISFRISRTPDAIACRLRLLGLLPKRPRGQQLSFPSDARDNDENASQSVPLENGQAAT